MNRVYLIVLLIFSLSFGAETQRKYKSDNHYFGLIVGIGGGDDLQKIYPEFAGEMAVNYQHDKYIYSIRHSGLTEFYMDGPDPARYVIDTSVLYGWCRKNLFKYSSFSFGLGYVRGMDRGKFIGLPGVESYEHEKLPFKSIGLSFDAQYFLLSPIIGLGGCIYGNINPKMSYMSIAICIQLGYLVNFK